MKIFDDVSFTGKRDVVDSLIKSILVKHKLGTVFYVLETFFESCRHENMPITL